MPRKELAKTNKLDGAGCKFQVRGAMSLKPLRYNNKLSGPET